MGGGGLKKNLRDKISRTQEPMGYKGYEKESVCAFLAGLLGWVGGGPHTEPGTSMRRRRSVQS